MRIEKSLYDSMSDTVVAMTTNVDVGISGGGGGGGGGGKAEGRRSLLIIS